MPGFSSRIRSSRPGAGPGAFPRALLRLALAAALTGGVCGCPPRLDEVEKRVRDGNAHYAAGDFVAAETAYDGALELRPAEAGILLNRGNARLMLEEYEGALEDYDAVLRTQPGFAAAYANRGVLKDRLGDSRGAVADYRRALELDPGLGEAPGVWQRLVSDRPAETIRDRLQFLERQPTGSR